ncbi:hypothetical protein [Pseudonocardia sp. T1-2H]|uniref:hypothetical protein n=1 Tax=Pseudonocardia sp. T1-2H TaxID=3128899 RepID=UPI003100ED74
MSDNEVEANQPSVAGLAVRLHRIADQLALAPSGALRVVSVSDECAQSGQHGVPLFILQGQQPARRVAVAGLRSGAQFDERGVVTLHAEH